MALWEFNQVFDTVGEYVINMAATDDNLWALVTGVHPISGNDGRIYYSGDGSNYVEDAAWAGPVDAGQVFIHQGLLHLIGNHAADGGRLYRRQGGAWVLVQTQADADLIYGRATSNDAWIIICGYENNVVGVLDEAVIFRWDGSNMTQDFRGGVPGVYPYDYVATESVYYTNGEWYAITLRWLDAFTLIYVLRNRGGGAWPIFHVYGGSGNVGQLTVCKYGLMWGNELWNLAGNWVVYPFSGDKPWTARIEFGQPVTARAGAGDRGEICTFTGSSWRYRGEVAGFDMFTYGGFAKFEGRLYVGATSAGDDPSGIWRITLPHKTIASPGHWTKPTANQLVCDHEYGDTIYFATYDDDSGESIMMSIDDDLDEWHELFNTDVYVPSDTFMQVQTANRRNTAYAFGRFDTDNQIQVTDDGGASFSGCDNDWGTDKITTMEYLPTAGSDLTITNYKDEDLFRSTSGLAPWVKRGDIPGPPLSQLRDSGVIFVGSTGGDLYKSNDIGQTFSVVGAGLPAVDILDLELG